MDKPQASDSYLNRSRTDRRRVRKIRSPNTDKMPGLVVPDPIIKGKYTEHYYKTATKRNQAMKKYKDAIKIR